MPPPSGDDHDLVPDPTHCRVAIAASHGAIRAGLTSLLRADRGLAVVATAHDRRGAARCLLQHHPDVLLLALRGALSDGGTLVRDLLALDPEVAIVVTGTGRGNAYISVARSAGARSYVPLDDPPEVLVAAVGSA